MGLVETGLTITLTDSSQTNARVIMMITEDQRERIMVEDRGEGAVEMVGGAMVTEAPHPGATSNRNHPERSRGPPPSPSGNSTTCPNREAGVQGIMEMTTMEMETIIEKASDLSLISDIFYIPIHRVYSQSEQC